MAYTYPKIIQLAKDSGLPNNPTSTLRIGARTKRGNVSWHASGRAVDFWGASQDALAAYFLGMETLEVFHYSKATGRGYASSKGQVFDINTRPDLRDEHTDHLHVAMSEAQTASVQVSNPLTALLGGVGMSNVPMPWDAAASVADVFRPFGIAGANLVNPNFWRRLATGAIGVTFIMIGIVLWSRRSIQSGTSAILGVGREAGMAAVQGYAFGRGAGGGVVPAAPAAPVTAVPVKPKGPFPPRKALPQAQVTAPLPPEIYAPQSTGGTYSVTTYRGTAKNPTQYQRPSGGSLIDKASARTGTPGKKKKKGF